MEFSFKIQEIKEGWFDVIISHGDDFAFITNSYYRGNDAPRILLKNILELCETNCERLLCWHDEPGAYIWQIRRQNANVRVRIADAEKSSFQLDYEGRGLKKEKIGEKYLSFQMSFKVFITQIAEAFREYSSGEALEKYEKEWGEFPAKEFAELESKLNEPMCGVLQ